MMEKGENGVILISLGTMVSTMSLPEQIKDAFLKGLYYLLFIIILIYKSN